jgi:hypothetical protein
MRRPRPRRGMRGQHFRGVSRWSEERRAGGDPPGEVHPNLDEAGRHRHRPRDLRQLSGDWIRVAKPLFGYRVGIAKGQRCSPRAATPGKGDPPNVRCHFIEWPGAKGRGYRYPFDQEVTHQTYKCNGGYEDPSSGPGRPGPVAAALLIGPDVLECTRGCRAHRSTRCCRSHR